MITCLYIYSVPLALLRTLLQKVTSLTSFDKLTIDVTFPEWPCVKNAKVASPGLVPSVREFPNGTKGRNQHGFPVDAEKWNSIADNIHFKLVWLGLFYLQSRKSIAHYFFLKMKRWMLSLLFGAENFSLRKI